VNALSAVVPSDPKIEHIGPYRVLRPLSPDGSGDAILAADEAGEPVVLKPLGAADPNQPLLDPKIADDARAYARLSHPNLVRIIDLFSADGQFFVAMEYINGRSLDAVHMALVDDADVDDACWIYVASSIFAALAAAHGAVDADGKHAPIVHQRVSPAHIQVSWDGTVKLGAFSMVDVVRVTQGDSDGCVAVSSSRYIAPEQANQASVGLFTDVYSAMLVVREIVGQGRDLRPGAAARVTEMIRAGMEPDPTRRLGSAARARDVFREAIDMKGARRQFAAALARMRELEDVPVSRELAPTRPCVRESAPARPLYVPMLSVPESSPATDASPETDDSPTVVRPPTDEELQALSAIRPKPVVPAAPAPEPEERPAPSPRRPPPLPPRAKAQRSAVHAAPSDAVELETVVELDIEPEPEPEREHEPQQAVHGGQRPLRAGFRVIRGALRSK
jgi:serine/threonine protein kinase